MFDGVSAHISGDRGGADALREVGEWFGRRWGCNAGLRHGHIAHREASDG